MRTQRGTNCRIRAAFTLVELVMVVTIIGTIAAIAAPRMSGAASNSTRNALEASISHVRTAIDCYYAEHSRYPGYVVASGTPDGTAFVNQLTLFSDAKGNTNASSTSPYLYGPYLRAPFPTNPFNNLSTVHVKANLGSANPAPGSTGWIAVLSHGYFGINATAADFIKFKMNEVEAQEGVTIIQ